MRRPRNRVVQVRRFGGPDGLEGSTPLPKARGRCACSPRAWSTPTWQSGATSTRKTMRRRPPFVLGYDVVGEIDQFGDGASGFRLGDRVADLTVLGSNAACRTLQASHLTRVPAGVDAAEAAALIFSWTTAYQFLHRATRVQRGQRMLVHGASPSARPSSAALPSHRHGYKDEFFNTIGPTADTRSASPGFVRVRAGGTRPCFLAEPVLGDHRGSCYQYVAAHWNTVCAAGETSSSLRPVRHRIWRFPEADDVAAVRLFQGIEISDDVSTAIGLRKSHKSHLRPRYLRSWIGQVRIKRSRIPS